MPDDRIHDTLARFQTQQTLTLVLVAFLAFIELARIIGGAAALFLAIVGTVIIFISVNGEPASRR